MITDSFASIRASREFDEHMDRVFKAPLREYIKREAKSIADELKDRMQEEGFIAVRDPSGGVQFIAPVTQRNDHA